MLFTLGHGQHIVVEDALAATRSRRAAGGMVPLDAVVDAAGAGRSGARLGTDAPAIGGPFGYFFDQAPEAPHDDDTAIRLDALADAMVEGDGSPETEPENSNIPPVFTYLGQFIDHDITANTDRETDLSIITGDDLTPISRADVIQRLVNLRSGYLELDSLYGDAAGQGPFSQKLARLMRHPTMHAKMRLGVPTATDQNRPPLPADPAADLLRLGRLMGEDPDASVTKAELESLPADLRRNFLDDQGNLIIQKAVIGDDRNDENLIVAQLHCAFLRLHNKIVDNLPDGSDPDVQDRFEAARRFVRWHYQWLVVNAYLPTICKSAVLDEVVKKEAPLYSAFHDRIPGTRRQMPLPLEFSVAAFRFGHSMIRAAYDHNRFFGRSEDGSPTILPAAPFEQLFNFTGKGRPPMSPGGGTPSSPTLPNNWIIEWDRFIRPDPTFSDRGARKIDTRLSFPLSELKNEEAGLFKHLARRNLRRGHRLNLPCAQDCIASLNETYGSRIRCLSESELASGPAGGALRDGNFLQKTPLWFYILREAEMEGGEHLGDLGSTLVAETLVGLVVKDPSSYWHQAGPAKGRWHPRDGIKPGGTVIDSMESMFEAVGLLAP